MQYLFSNNLEAFGYNNTDGNFNFNKKTLSKTWLCYENAF